jgi:hypothetical protein
MAPGDLNDSFVLETVQNWFSHSHELWVEVYYPHSGAGATFYLVPSFADFQDLVREARRGAVFFVLRQPQYPVRGVVDPAFIQQALATVPNGAYWEIVDLAVYPAALSLLGDGQSHRELREQLELCRGSFVGFGPEPDTPERYWVKNTSDDCMIAFKRK